MPRLHFGLPLCRQAEPCTRSSSAESSPALAHPPVRDEAPANGDKGLLSHQVLACRQLRGEGFVAAIVASICPCRLQRCRQHCPLTLQEPSLFVLPTHRQHPPGTHPAAPTWQQPVQPQPDDQLLQRQRRGQREVPEHLQQRPEGAIRQAGGALALCQPLISAGATVQGQPAQDQLGPRSPPVPRLSPSFVLPTSPLPFCNRTSHSSSTAPASQAPYPRHLTAALVQPLLFQRKLQLQYSMRRPQK